MSDLAALTQEFTFQRAALCSRDRRSTGELRQELVDLHETWLGQLAAHAGLNSFRVALVAVGGMGRREMCANKIGRAHV